MSHTFAQNILSGKVTSQNNEELIGVNIYLKDISGLELALTLMAISKSTYKKDVMIYYFNTSVIKIF